MQKCECNFAIMKTCRPMSYRLPATRFGFWLKGKLGRAWVGALVVHGMVHGVVYGCMVAVDVMMWGGGWEKCMGII